MTGLFRRGGMWWARLVVPKRLRDAAGRREFVQSCRTHELAVAKLVAVVLLADWHQQLLKLDSHTMSPTVLKLVHGSPFLAGSGWVALSEAVDFSGISLNQLLRAAANGSLQLYCRLSWAKGVIMPIGELGLERVILTPSGKTVTLESAPLIPERQEMPECVYDDSKNGIQRVFMSREVADEILANGLEEVSIRLFHHDNAHVFVTNHPATIVVERFEVLVTNVDALRQRVATLVTPHHLEQARASQRSQDCGTPASTPRKAQRRFSEALEAYSTASSGIPGSVTSLAEQKQKRRGCSLFIELVGDLHL